MSIGASQAAADAHADDPAALLQEAWDREPLGQYRERTAALGRLQALLESGAAWPAPPGRDWSLELLAERAVDEAREKPGERKLVDQVLAATAAGNPAHRIARGRALLAGGTALAWTGTDTSINAARREYQEAATIFADLGRNDWQGSALARNGYHAHFQAGDLLSAEELLREAIEVFGPGQRRDGILSYYADVLLELGEFDRADELLVEAGAAADARDDVRTKPEVPWTRALVAAARGDARATERFLREAERLAPAADWFQSHIGGAFFAEAAMMLDRVGLGDQAREYLAKCEAHCRDFTGEDPPAQVYAFLTARSGDPLAGLDALQAIVRESFIEKRYVWRHQLMAAWATFRAGRAGAGELASQALATAADLGGGDLRVAMALERELTTALAPLAERAGSKPARELLMSGRQFMLRLSGTPTVTTADGVEVELPPGNPGELVRMLALEAHGLPVDVVLDRFFPEADPTAGRHRLRQMLTRIRAAAGELVVRDEDQLRLVPVWIDATEFILVADRARSARGTHAVQLAYAALALVSGPLLPSDPYAEWAISASEDFQYRRLELLDLIAADADARDSHRESLTAMEEALALDPDDTDRQRAMVGQLQALGRHQAAAHHDRRV